MTALKTAADIQRDFEAAERFGLTLEQMKANCDNMADRIAGYIREAICNGNVMRDGELDDLLIKAKNLRAARADIVDRLFRRPS